jgi:hypothetical protein
MMLHFEIDTLPTMPEPDHHVILAIPSPGSSVGGRLACGDLGGRAVFSLDRTNSKHLALMHEARWLFSGAGAGSSTALTCSSVSPSVAMIRSRTGCVGGCLSCPRS